MAGFWINGPHTGSGFGAIGVGGVGVIDGNGDGIWWQVLALAFCGHWAVGGPANNFTMTQFSKLDEYIFQFGQKHFPILMNIFCYSDNIFSSGFLRAMGSSGSLTMAGLCDTRPLGRDKPSGGRGRGSGTKQQKCGQPTNQPHDEDATVQHEVSSRQTEAWLTRPLVATRKSFVQDRNLLQLGYQCR